MANYVKLGSKASIFYDPSTRLKIIGDQVAKIKGKQKFSKKIDQALKGGHLEKVSASEYEQYVKSLEVKGDTAVLVEEKKKEETKKVDEPTFPESFQDFDERSLNKLNKEELKTLAKYYESELSDEELETLKKTELIEEVLSLVEEEEEDEE